MVIKEKASVMDNYLSLRYTLQKVKAKISNAEQQLHRLLVREHWWWFFTLHALMFLALLFNLGALTLSNAIIMKDSAEAGETIQFLEGNPFSVQTSFQTVGLMIGLLSLGMLLRQAVLWIVMLLGYVYVCKNIHSKLGLWLLTVMVLWFVVTLGFDFFHDFGFVLGKMVWGG